MDTSRIIKGDDLMVFVNDKAVAFATAHTLTLNSNLTEINCKDGNGWSTGIAGSKSWECTSENLYAVHSNSYMYTAYSLVPLFVEGTPVDIKFTLHSGALSGTTSPAPITDDTVFEPDNVPPGVPMMSGKAIITSLSVNANSGDNATMSISFKGITPIEVTLV